METKQADGGCGSAGVSRTESAWPEVPCGEEQPAAGKGCWRTAVGMETDHQYVSWMLENSCWHGNRASVCKLDAGGQLLTWKQSISM